MIRNGTDLHIVLNGTTIPSSTNVSLDLTRDLIQVTTQPTNGFVERIPGNRDGTLSFEGFFDAAVDNIDPGTFVEWRFRSIGGTFHGEGYVISLGISGGTDEAPTRFGEIQTTGQIFFSEQLEEELCVNGVRLCVETEGLRALV